MSCFICGGDHPAGIGGSAMGRILGLVPGVNALDVYHEMTRPRGEERRNVDLFRGTELEPKIAEWYWKRTGRKGRRFSGTATHPDYPAFQCHLDLDIFSDDERPEGFRGPGVGEIKAPRAKVVQRILDHGLRDSEVVQILTYCAVTRREWGGFALGSTEHDGVYDPETDTAVLAVDVRANETVGNFLLEAGQRFYDEHVLARVPPDPAEWRGLWEATGEAEPFRGTTGDVVVVEGGPDAPEHVARIVALGDRVLELKRTRKQADEAYRERTDEMKALIAKHVDSDRIQIPGKGKFTIVRNAGRKTFSSKAIEGHRPIDRDLLLQYIENLPGDGIVDPDLGPIVRENFDEWLASLELDLEKFYRQGEPFDYLLPTEKT